MSVEVVGPGRVAVVTGAASGIGRALAEAFGAAGSAVVLADIDPDLLARVAQELESSGLTVAAVPTDVSDPAAVDRLAAVTVGQFGRVDVLCNNAGVSTFNLLVDQTLDDWHWVFNVNLWGVVNGLHAFLPVLREQTTPSHIVNTASIIGLAGGQAMVGPYAASKAAVVAISETLRLEVEMLDLPIGVSVLCPAIVKTNVLNGERVRPVELGRERRGTMAQELVRATRELEQDPSGIVLQPAAVAERVLAAIRADEFLIVTHGGMRPYAEARFDQVLSAFPG